jgi:hypothetical protein
VYRAAAFFPYNSANMVNDNQQLEYKGTWPFCFRDRHACSAAHIAWHVTAASCKLLLLRGATGGGGVGGAAAAAAAGCSGEGGESGDTVESAGVALRKLPQQLA